ncbi:hypothetical protein ADK65_14100 [Streptomyces sp. NRRL B-1140]|uniref:hypothetical protein n=1 Tax=Streptomyces sp. NRRL B-1140 TaxID=1415549 RepID=UPI0006B06364|nr:hypothetical protein [Streptomyces sp. NRRL B-1140]KOX00744.1 hypothetical protein ADK65_14100 [Streptomyces sp. NRRL B-1140]
MFTRTTDRILYTRGTAMLVSALTAGAIFTASTGAHATEATPRTTAPVSTGITAPVSTGITAPVSTGITASASASASASADSGDDADDAQWEALLNSMLSVPEDVLAQGDEATAAYLKQQQNRKPGQALVGFGWPSFGCMGAVAVAIGTNLLPAAKMVKIVKVAKRVGVKRIVSAIKAIRKGKGHTLANDLQWVGAQLLGLEGVKAACH